MKTALAVPIVAVAALALTSTVGGDGAAAQVSRDVLMVCLGLYATGCGVVATRSTQGRVRGGWMTLAVALGAWALGDLIWLMYEVVLDREPPLPSPADLFYVAFGVLAPLAVVRLSTVTNRQTRVRILLDAVVVALCLFLLAWIVVLGRIYDAILDDKATFTVALVYPVLDLAALTVGVVMLARAEPRQRYVLALITAAIALTTAADCAYAYLTAGGQYATGHVIDILWAAALAIYGIAAQIGARVPGSTKTTTSMPSTSSLWLPYVPLLLAGTVGPALIMSGLERVIVPLIVVAVCARQSLAAWENRRLLTAAADQALRDPLTGLANRTLFHDRLTHAMMLRARDGRPVTVLSLDLDDFKLVNDSLGHPAADSLLIRVGKRLTECVRSGDTVARVGGDEFALLLEGDLEDSLLVGQRVVDVFNDPFVIDGQRMLMRPSIGVAVAPDDEPDLAPETLIKRADIAMYAAKRSRSADFHTFHDEMMLLEPDVVDLVDGAGRPPRDGAEQVRLLGELRHAIAHGRLAMVYQPKLALSSEQVVGVEALLRWPHPQKGILRPDSFMSLVRKHGLMRQVTDLVLDMVLDDAAGWVARDIHIPIAVNLFAPFLRDVELPDSLIAALRQRDLPADILTIEITEDLVLSEVAKVTAVLQRLRAHGIRVAIDDFGSGYSALSYLRDLPIDEVKLDRAFIASVTTDERAAAVVRAVIRLIHDLGITVVAEGVESADTADWLLRHRCDIGQGYHFGRPVSADKIPELMTVGVVRPRTR